MKKCETKLPGNECQQYPMLVIAAYLPVPPVLLCSLLFSLDMNLTCSVPVLEID